MASEISFLKDARQDIDETLAWYELQKEGLSGEILTEIEQALDKVQSFPKAYPIKYKSLRIILLNKFPYALIYDINDKNDIRVYAFLHLKQNIEEIIKER